MSIVQTFYDNMASQYDKLFLDWEAESREQARLLGGGVAASGGDGILPAHRDRAEIKAGLHAARLLP